MARTHVGRVDAGDGALGLSGPCGQAGGRDRARGTRSGTPIPGRTEQRGQVRDELGGPGAAAAPLPARPVLDARPGAKPGGRARMGTCTRCRATGRSTRPRWRPPRRTWSPSPSQIWPEKLLPSGQRDQSAAYIAPGDNGKGIAVFAAAGWSHGLSKGTAICRFIPHTRIQASGQDHGNPQASPAAASGTRAPSPHGRIQGDGPAY